jgi:crossover junction endodeoxyribonuclease RuvC
MIILGIDPGIADTGWGIVEDKDGKLKCLGYGSIKTKAGLPTAERLMLIASELKKIINQFAPAAAAIEELFFAKNVKTAMVVGQARGVVILTLQQADLPTVEFKPAQVKQAVAAYGAAGKAQVQKMVQLILGLKELPKPDDAADALAVAICGLNSASFYAGNLGKKS